MTTSTTSTFDNAVHVATSWIKDLAKELGDPHDEYRAYHAMRAVLHALRDRLPITEAADLAAQLPMLIRGFYYEGWRPVDKPLRERSREQFFSHVSAAFRDEICDNPAFVTRAVFHVLERHISPGEINDVKASLPHEIRALWV
jgi:uncharacterized protein (DUF2267 family)